MHNSVMLPGLRFRRLATIVATAMLSVAALLAPAPRAHSQEVTPDLSSARRIVAISGDVTEIIYALGEEGRLVARDSTSLYPEAATTLPDVGYMRALSPEGVLSVNPDAVLASKGSGPPEAIDVLRKASVPFVFVPDGYDEAAIVAKVKVIGEALGVADKAAELSAKVEADLADAKARTANIVERKRVLFILSMQGGKVLAAGSNTAAAGVISLAGAVNAVEGFAGYKPLTDEAIVSARPDVILMMDRTGNHAAGTADFASHPALSQTPAIKTGAIVKMDGGYLLGFGPRTADAVRDLARAFYGDAIVN